MNKLIASILMLVGFAFNAQAGFLVDPYVGYGTTKTTLDSSSASLADDTKSSSYLGARVGYSFLLFSAGLDYQKMDDDNVEQTNMSLFAGVDLPILLRGWVEYFVNSDAELSGTTDLDFKDGFGIGLGFTGLPFVSLNLEIQTLNYEGVIPAIGAGVQDIKTAAYILSVSLPIDL